MPEFQILARQEIKEGSEMERQQQEQVKRVTEALRFIS